jgi:hypothetical protein
VEITPYEGPGYSVLPDKPRPPWQKIPSVHSQKLNVKIESIFTYVSKPWAKGLFAIAFAIAAIFA